MKNNYYTWAKFICPTCGKRFRSKIDPRKDIIEYAGGAFECHTHCPRCEEYIPWRDYRRKNAKR